MKQFNLSAIILALLTSSQLSLAQVQFLEELQPEPYSDPVAGVSVGNDFGIADGTIVSGPVFQEPFCGPEMCGPPMCGPIFEDPGTPVCNCCMQPGCNGKCQRLIRRLGFWGGGIIDIPLEGVIHTEASTFGSAAGFGVDPAVLAPATEIGLFIEEGNFDDAYDYFYGYQANLSIEMDASTKIYVGYREVVGESDEYEAGQMVVDPFGPTPTTAPLFAQFDDYSEYSIQVGFLTSRSWHRHVEFLWGGRGGVSFVDEIGVDLFSPGVLQIDDVEFYQESTILTFGVNLGLRWNAKPNFAIVALSGAEYRTSLDEIDTALDTLGLGNLNNGSGFVTLPFYLGFTLKL